MARDAGLSRPHFYKLFRREIGVTPNIYLNTLRMEKAIERLGQTEHSITTIADDLGFSCQSVFTRFFSSHVGMPPTDYRRAVQVLHSKRQYRTERRYCWSWTVRANVRTLGDRTRAA